jgi:hypothetical protein
MNIADMPYLMDRRDGGYSNDYTIKVYEHIPTGSNYLIDKRNFVGSFQSMLSFATELMHRVSNMPSHAIAFNQDTGEEHQINEDGSYTITRSRFDEGGEVEGGENKEMLENQANNIEHHIKELKAVLKNVEEVEPWVITKAQRCVTDLMDITHYLEGDVKAEKGEAEEYSEGGEVKWQEAEYGDNALVVSENKMGMIIKPYGRKFHLKFVDGTEKTYDASELKFFKDMDDFDMGGEVDEDEEDLFENYDKIPKNVQKVLDKYSDAFEDGDYKGLEKANKELEKIGYTFEYGLDGQAYDLRKIGKKGKSESYKEGGEVKVGDKVKSKSGVEGEVYESTGMFFKLKDKYGNKNPKLFSVRDFKPSEIKSMADGGTTDPMATANEVARLSGVRTVAITEWADKNNINLNEILRDLKAKKIKGIDIMTAIAGKPNNKYAKQLNAKYSRLEGGGKVKFADKVASVKASLLKRKKVPKAVQKDYGKTFSPAEAEDSAKRIVGAMTAKERLQARIKKSKK